MSRLELQPRARIARRLSGLEYGHMAAGSSPGTLDPPRVITMVLEGKCAGAALPWADALRAVAAANPGLRLRVVGRRQRARWTDQGVSPPQVRIMESSAWDGLSHRGLEAIEEKPLPLHSGPGLELVVATGETTRLLLRVRHAVMDGLGIQHCFEELFRALRGERLIGTNAGFSDADLMRAVSGKGAGFAEGEPIPLTGGARGTSRGDVWQRMILTAWPSNVLGRVAETAARYAWTFRTGSVRIAIPVDLRRHLPDLRSTMNYAGMVYVELNSGETAADFRRKLRERLAQNAETGYPAILDGVRYLPPSWVDRLSGRTPRNYLRRKLIETVLISNLGLVSPAALSCAQFRPQDYYCLPVMGNSHITLATCGSHLNIVVGMPAVYGSEGRLERFMGLLREALATSAHGADGVL